MSEFSLDRELHRGLTVTGSGTVYTLPDGTRSRIETLTFVLTAASSPTLRNLEVAFFNQAGLLIGRVSDENDVAANLTVTYTFGIGLAAFCGVNDVGLAIRAELPDTVLEGGSTITVRSLDPATGTVAASDVIDSVTVYGPVSNLSNAPDLIPLLTPIALADQVGAALGGALGAA